MKIELHPLHVVLEEIEQSHAIHYQDMDMDWELYRALGNTGSIAAVTMHDGDKLVGWAVFVLATNPRYKTRLEAESQGLFIEKEYRARWSSVFIKQCLEYMRTIGAVETNFTESDNKVGRWLSKHGAKPTYKIYSFSHAN